MEKIILESAFTEIHDHWNPRIAATLNGQHVKLVKFKGAFVWHKHDEEDELFYVLSGVLTSAFRDRNVILGPGEFIIVPKGVEHKPIAENEVELMLFEPVTTLNTGDATDSRTREQLDSL